MGQISAYIVNTPTALSKNASMGDGTLDVLNPIVIVFVPNANVLDGSRIDAAVLCSKGTVCNSFRAKEVILERLIEHQ